MPARTPAGGRGSNQYVTKGVPATPPSRTQTNGGMSAEDVAWRFDADFADWHAAGVDTVEERNQWTASGVGPDNAEWWYWQTTPTDEHTVADACRRNPGLGPVYVCAFPDRYGEVFLRSATDLNALRGWMGQFAQDQLQSSPGEVPDYGPVAVLEYALRHKGCTPTVTVHTVDRENPRPVLLFLDDGQGHAVTELFASESEADARVRERVEEDWGSVEGYDDEPGDRVAQYFEHHAEAFYVIAVDWSPLSTPDG